jgi:hemoglobin-like flavoprotein
VVGHVLIGAIAEVAGDAWTPEHQAAWTAAFDVVAEAMLEGAREAQLPQAA